MVTLFVTLTLKSRVEAEINRLVTEMQRTETKNDKNK